MTAKSNRIIKLCFYKVKAAKVVNCNHFFLVENRHEDHHEDRNTLQEVLLQGDFSLAETPVNPHSAQLCPHDTQCCPESEK